MLWRARERFGQQHIVDLHAADHRLAVEPVVGNVLQPYRIEFVPRRRAESLES
jgi:hypothetical protein